MNKLNFFIILVFFSCVANCQSLIEDGSVGLIKDGYVNPGSTALSHIRKSGITKDLITYDCHPEYFNQKNNVYTVNQQSDLLYYEAYSDSTKLNITTQGYYRLIFLDDDFGYCWVKDLVWNYFNLKGYLIKKEYYNNGKLIPSPAMPQPSKL